MKRPALASPPLALLLAPLLASGALGLVQGRALGFDDRKGTKVNAKTGFFDQRSGGRIGFDLAGGVSGSSSSQGIPLFLARRAKGVLVPDPVRKGAMRLNDLQATGGVTLVRSRVQKGVRGTTTMKAASALYDAGEGESAEVTLKGGVALTDVSGPTNVSLTGNDGRAALSTATETKTPLKSATLVGNVRIKARRRDDKGAVGLYNASGDRLDYVANADGTSTATLTGDLKFDSPGSGEGGETGGVITGATRAVLTLSGAGEVTNVRLSSDGATPVRTVFKTGKKKGR